MIVFADNDILIKLAGCELLIPFCEAVGVHDTEIFVTQSARFAIPKQSRKKLTAPESFEQLKLFIERTATIQQVHTETDILDLLVETPDIDGGEAFLILSAYNTPETKLATGDKRCLSALLNTPSLIDIANGLGGRVYTLEIALLILISRLGFDSVNHRVLNRCVTDGTLNLAFGTGRTEDNAIECLSSYCSDFTPLLSDTHLIKRL